ncbi:hypothetical protein QCA50_020191 [Cerrena zonata]|uniref:Uncharacterized protein n=1 Tax=Cerrena zonata TaxID=2478898 RepID=A0AAW0FJM9_9APHY
MPTIGTAPEDGLTPVQQEFLRTYFDAYLGAQKSRARRIVAIKASIHLARECSITGHDECTKLRKTVISYMYDRLVRDTSHLKPERYGFLKKVSARKLWARSCWDSIKEDVDAYAKKKKMHRLTAYHAVTKAMFAGLEDDERKAWAAEAKLMNQGTGSKETKAVYGDLVYTEFINNVLYSAQNWFGAHMIIISNRPSVALGTDHANSIKETMPLHTWQRTFLQNYKNPFKWNVQDYPPWTVQMNDPDEASSTYITFDSRGERLLPTIHTFTLAKDRVKVLQTYFTTHYCMAAGNPSTAPPYIDFPNDGDHYLDKMYFPPEALEGDKILYLRKPGQLGVERLHHWLIHLLERQRMYLAGEGDIRPFRWKGVKQDGEIVEAKYTPKWMCAYTKGLASGVAKEATSAEQVQNEEGSRSETPPPVPMIKKKRTTRKRIESDSENETDGEDAGPPEGASDYGEMYDDDDDELEEDLVLSAIRQHGSEDEADLSDVETEDAEENTASTPHCAQPLMPVDAIDDELFAMLSELETSETGQNFIVPPLAPPVWVSDMAEKKVPFLRALSTNPDFLAIVDWYNGKKVQVRLPPTPFDWISWESDAAHLPSDCHQDKGTVASILRFLTKWKKECHQSFHDLPMMEARLLFIGLLLRDMSLVLFDFDAEEDPVDKPTHFLSSLLTLRVFDVFNHTLKALAECIPVEGENVPAANPIIPPPSSIAPALQSISSLASRYPKPPPCKKKLVRIASTPETVVPPSLPAQMDRNAAESSQNAATTSTPVRRGGKKKAPAVGSEDADTGP